MNIKLELFRLEPYLEQMSEWEQSFLLDNLEKARKYELFYASHAQIDVVMTLKAKYLPKKEPPCTVLEKLRAKKAELKKKYSKQLLDKHVVDEISVFYVLEAIANTEKNKPAIIRTKQSKYRDKNEHFYGRI